MLKGISPLIQPELLKVLAEMGHGDEIVFGDSNFPAETMGKRCIRCDGLRITDLLEAILPLFPLDDYVESPAILMEVTPGTLSGDPPVWDEYRKIVSKFEPKAGFDFEERFNFYERSKKAYAVIQSGETALYANIILRKGVISF